MEDNKRFVLNVTNYLSGFDLTGYRHELQIETEKEEYLNYSSKPIKIVWYSGGNSALREMEIHGKIVQAYQKIGRVPMDIELIACKWHMAKQEAEAEAAYTQGWYVAWQGWMREAEIKMVEEINRIRKEKGYTA